MVLVLVQDGDLQDVMDVLHLAGAKVSRSILVAPTYKVKTFCQTGLRVLYSVCVATRLFTSSSTAKGSLLPPRSAELRPVALITLTTRWPTSFIL